MDYTPYVLFRENTTLHAMQYIARDPENNKLVPTKVLRLALRFETRGMAYEFGRLNNLSWWRVGIR